MEVSTEGYLKFTEDVLKGAKKSPRNIRRDVSGGREK
jgi:hypothetical protein